MDPVDHIGPPPHPHPQQVDGMEVEIASITQLTDSVQLAESQKHILSPQHANDSDSGMDLDGDTDPSRHFPSVRRPELDVRDSIPKWFPDKSVGTHTQIVGGWDLAENPSSSDDTLLESGTEHLPPALTNNSREVYTIFRTPDSHEDDLEDSEWLDNLSVCADTQSIILDDSEDGGDGETSEDDDEMLSGDEAVLAGDA